MSIDRMLYSPPSLRVRLLTVLLSALFLISLWLVVRIYQISYNTTYDLLQSHITQLEEELGTVLRDIETSLQVASWQAASNNQGFELSHLAQALQARRLSSNPAIASIAWGNTNGRITPVPGFDTCIGYDVEELLRNSAENRAKLNFGTYHNCNANTPGLLAAFAVSNSEGIYLGSLVLHLTLDMLNSTPRFAEEGARYIVLTTTASSNLLNKAALPEKLQNHIINYIHQHETRPTWFIAPISSLLYKVPNMVISTMHDYGLHIVVLSSSGAGLPEFSARLLVMLSDLVFVLLLLLLGGYTIRYLVSTPITKLMNATVKVVDGTECNLTTYNIAEYDTIANGIRQIASQRAELQAGHEKRVFLLRQLKTETEAQAEFIRNLQHEIRTPLHHIITGSDILLRQTQNVLPSEDREYLEMINQAGNQLLRLGNEMMAAANLESGRTLLKEECCDISTMLLSVIARIRAKAIKQQVQLQHNISPALPQVYVDPTYFEDALYYIVENSVQYSKAEGIVYIVVKRVNIGMVIEINDDGYGITDERMAKITSAFEGTHSVLRKAQEGVGLGLVIAYSILEMHDSKLELSSKEGTGTIARVTLPNIRLQTEGDVSN